MEIYCCETCDREVVEDGGTLYQEEGIFECDSCYDARLDADYEAMQDYAATYPHLDRLIAVQQADPVGFYFACKDSPDSLDY